MSIVKTHIFGSQRLLPPAEVIGRIAEHVDYRMSEMTTVNVKKRLRTSEPQENWRGKNVEADCIDLVSMCAITALVAITNSLRLTGCHGNATIAY